MSSKKNRKLINIMLSAIMLMGSCMTVSYAQTPKGKNGIAYVLLSPDISNYPGVYRFNDADGNIVNPSLGSPLFTVSNMYNAGDDASKIKISGLAANQKNQIFLFKATTASEDAFKDAEPGWLPNMSFPDDSPIYVSAAKPGDFEAKEYIRPDCPHGPYGSTFPDNSSDLYVFWYKNVTLAGNTYKYVCRFNGPDGVRYLNSKDGIRGTPIWDGTYKSDPNSTNSSAIKHPKDDKKIILPSHFGAVCYYLYATTSCTKFPLFIGKPMDGGDYIDADGNIAQRPVYELDKSNDAGVFPGDKVFDSRHLFACIVKHIYQKRENPLDLYCGDDTTSSNIIPVGLSLKEESKKVLNSIDVKVKEAYGKICGDNCITGGAPPDNTAIAAMAKVNVVTSTTGRRYGFNPLGVFFNPQDSIDASLRVVEKGKLSQTIDIATDAKGENFNNVITNKDYLISQGITPASIKTIGVSSNFSKNSNYDFIYGSPADKFVVQDSWWGVGGLAYEYYKETEDNPSYLKKLDYVNNTIPDEIIYENQLTGKIDSIAIDGDGFLYALKTEEEPTDLETINANSEISASSIVPEKALSSVSFGKYVDPLIVQVETPNNWIRETVVKIGGEEILITESIPNGQEKPGDFKNVTLKQNVYKTVKRYAPASGGIGEEENRGHMRVGFDNWRNRIELTSNGTTFSYPFWVQEEENARISNLEAELAVVNIADSPILINGTEDHYITVVSATNNKPNYGNTTINEEDSLVFKIEGYKPTVKNEKGEDVVSNLKTIGDIYDDNGNPFLADVKLNNTPNGDGKYEHDENGDGFSSGFPSSMFEAKDYETEVTWYIAQVEDKTAVDLIDNTKAFTNRATLVNDITTKKGEGDFLTCSFDFKQPGRYIIQAYVTYNYFSNLGTAERPAQLQIAQSSFVTKPLLISVYANDLKLDQSPSYITNISMTMGNKHTGLSDSNKEDDEDLTNVEDDKFGDITVTFDAQFYRDSYNGESKSYEVHDGIGVWDYDYYSRLYKRAQNITNLKGIIVPSVSGTDHAYNYGNGKEDDLEGSYVTNILNPGKDKTTKVPGRSANAGTRVDTIPDKNDMKYIQWALYLRRTDKPENDVPEPTGLSIVDRGELITSGTFEKVKLENCQEISDRKYRISYTLPIDNTDKIRTPRDPKDYTLDLEIIYPRVTWLNNNLDDKIDNVKGLYSSVVPYLDTESGDAGPSPIHVISILKTLSAGKLVNQNCSKSGDDFSQLYEKKGGEDLPPTVKLAVRDKEIPTMQDLSKNLPRTETTGDPSDSAVFECEITDNNPFLAADNTCNKKLTKQIENNDAKKIPVLALQGWSNSSDIRYGVEKDNRKYFVENVRAEDITVAKSSTGDPDTYFALDDTWRFKLNYTMKVKSLAPDLFEPSNSNGTEITIAEKKNLKPENWIGTLNYGIVGRACDGKGKDGKKTYHYFYNKDVYADNTGIPHDSINIDESYEVPTAPYLERIDNDPPTIEVELISQNDNRRWVFQLIEGINDKVCYPQKVSDLAESTLVVKNLFLKNDNFDDTEQSYATYPVSKVPGTTNNPSIFGSVATVTTNLVAGLTEAIPTFRRASRLIILVNIFDNCGYKTLNNAKIKVVDASEVLLQKEINTGVSHNEKGEIVNFTNHPRGTFVVDMPMIVKEGNQVEITVNAEDHAGNQRSIVIPVKIVESTFETRVLETKEDRRD